MIDSDGRRYIDCVFCGLQATTDYSDNNVLHVVRLLVMPAYQSIKKIKYLEDTEGFLCHLDSQKNNKSIKYSFFPIISIR